MYRSINILFVVFLFINLGCSKDSPDPSNPDNPNEIPDSSENPDIDDDLIEVTGTVDLGDNLEGGNLIIIGLAGDYDVNDNGEYIAGVTERDKKVLFVENSSGELLYAAFVEDESQDINAETTAKVMFGMMPWTAGTSFSDLSNILDDLENKETYTGLVEAIEESVSSGQSPLTNETVLLKFEKLMGNSSANDQSILRIPEVDYLVEPKINYSNNNLIVNNDGTTTAAWGVEVRDFSDGSSLTDDLVLPGNKVSFPSFSGLFSYFYLDESSATDVVFQASEPLNIPIGVEGKYQIDFASPTRAGLLNSSLSWSAVAYNFVESYEDILSAFGLDVEFSVVFDQGCVNSIFDGTVNLMVNSIKENEFSTQFFISEAYPFLKSSVSSISECSAMFDNMDGIPASRKALFLRKALQFLNVYSKLETSFVLGKRFGDMALLNDISVCRQILGNEVFPCFKLVKIPDVDNSNIAAGTDFKITIGTELNIVPEEETYPEGAKIHWEVKEGDGALHSETTYVGAEGIAEVWFTAGEDISQVIIASVKNKNGEIIDNIEYNLEVSQFDFSGTWVFSYYTADPTHNNGEVLHQQKRFTLDASGYASESEQRFPYSGVDWIPGGSVQLRYEDGFIKYTQWFRVVVNDINDTVFYSANWNDTLTVEQGNYKVKLER
jgi:hypothetical protein